MCVWLAGYGIVSEPTFSVSRVAYILAYGGVYAVAGIRSAPLLHSDSETSLSVESVLPDCAVCCVLSNLDRQCKIVQLHVGSTRRARSAVSAAFC